jgi:hypothetical protein
MQEGYTMTEDDRKSFRILTNNVESGKQVLGLARHDGGEIALYTHVWLLLKTDHKQDLRPRTGNETKNDVGYSYPSLACPLLTRTRIMQIWNRITSSGLFYWNPLLKDVISV